MEPKIENGFLFATQRGGRKVTIKVSEIVAIDHMDGDRCVVLTSVGSFQLDYSQEAIQALIGAANG